MPDIPADAPICPFPEHGQMMRTAVTETEEIFHCHKCSCEITRAKRPPSDSPEKPTPTNPS